MKNKNRQNFTISEEISNNFKKVCDENAINMSKLIENFMVEYTEVKKFNSQIKHIIDNIEEIKNIALGNMLHDNFKTANISSNKDYIDDTDDIKRRIITTRIMMACNNIAFELRYGYPNICFIDNKYYNLLESLIINGEITGLKVIFSDKMDDYVICVKLLSEENIETIKLLNNPIQKEFKCGDISKQYAGFRIVE